MPTGKDVPVSNYRAIVAYDGTDYAGFQIQPDRETVQGHLEAALEHLVQTPVRVNAAGRTDAGVHAKGQVISFRAGWRHGVAVLQRGMNALLPPGIAVREVAQASERFHARYSALKREYVYNCSIGPVRRPLEERYALRIPKQLDVVAMQSAATLLVGRHDFGAFGQPPSGSNTVREVFCSEWYDRLASDHVPTWSRAGSDLSFHLAGTAFLRGMVRRIVGTLLLVGAGALDVGAFGAILESAEISRAAPPAPACGLCLWKVCYGADGQGR